MKIPIEVLRWRDKQPEGTIMPKKEFLRRVHDVMRKYKWIRKRAMAYVGKIYWQKALGLYKQSLHKTKNNPRYSYDVYLNSKKIDTIFYGINEPVDEVKRSLINHDGYDSNIVVRRGKTYGKIKKNPLSGKKLYYIQYNVGKAKYAVNFHDGIKKHKDGSAFYDIRIFHNKKDFKKFEQHLLKTGYTYRSAFSNPVKHDKPVEIYNHILDIVAIKGKNSNWKGEKFIHKFSRVNKAKIYGMPDGSLKIAGKKPLWKVFKYRKSDIKRGR